MKIAAEGRDQALVGRRGGLANEQDEGERMITERASSTPKTIRRVSPARLAARWASASGRYAALGTSSGIHRT